MYHCNPTFCATSLKILGIAEVPVFDVVKAYVKYQLCKQNFMVTMRTIAFQGKFKFVVDQDCCLYLRFESEHDAEILSATTCVLVFL